MKKQNTSEIYRTMFGKFFLDHTNMLISHLYYPSRKHTGVSATGEIRPKIKFAAFWCVFLTKIKVDPESW